MLYSVLEDAISRVKSRAITPEEENDDGYIVELLQMSYGLHKQTKELIYRPFWVAAKILQQSPFHQTLKKDDSTEFTGQGVPIRSLLDLQANLDIELDVRPGFGVEGRSGVSRDILKENRDRALLLFRQYLPRGYL